MKVLVAREVGFCFGVKRAINLTKQALAEKNNVFIVGDVVHNKAVIQDLESRGLTQVESYSDRKSGTALVRAHGIPRSELQRVRDSGLDVVDATCPIVKQAQDAARSLEAQGLQVIMIGDAEHAEVKGVLGSLEKPALIVNSVEDVERAKQERKLMRKVGVIIQTTHSLEKCYPIINAILALAKDVNVINTICRPVQSRQYDAVELAQEVDMMVIVGSPKSANTMQLRDLCAKYNPRTIAVDTVENLDLDLFKGVETVGLASGLSTPDNLIEEVKAALMTAHG
ncbi:MAG: 4-hydroxy-3-methylbut-2-enyl diphosphate reductase [Chloroflexi bacterium]|nr:4-hydroxy-3-methylbut-2-enyl diphosphate reductase [Chloroflexota bacterium]